jgi:YVTN family beta-propeller protein
VVIGTLPTGSGARGLAVSANGTRRYVSNRNTSTVSVINTATSTVIGTLQAAPAQGLPRTEPWVIADLLEQAQPLAGKGDT